MSNEISIDIIKPIFNTSPLRYPGGKTRACKKLDEILNQYFKKEINNKSNKSFDTIVSPFFGGGSFEFYLQNKYNLNIIANDKFAPLYNFWNICKNEKKNNSENNNNNNNDNDNDNRKDKLYISLYNDVISGISKEQFLEYRKNVLIETDKINQAEQYFIINRCSFSGATLSGGFSQEASKKRFTKSSVDRIKALDLSKFQIHNKDFEDFIKEIYQANTQNNALLFLDPPYYLEKNSKLYGNNGDMHENFEHKKLFDLLSKEENKNIKFMMTYNNCDYIKDLYSQNKNCKILDVNWSYGMNKSKESSEIVIIRN